MNTIALKKGEIIFRQGDVTPYRISAFRSRKFQKEMGIRLSDYIRDTRLE